jgi:hypothetical protein
VGIRTLSLIWNKNVFVFIIVLINDACNWTRVGIGWAST